MKTALAGLMLPALLAACAPSETPEPREQIANPASEHCIKVGGRLEMRRTPEGDAGYCHLPDGRVVDEWELFRAANPQPTH